MQCKDISDADFVSAVAEATRRAGGSWASRLEVAAVLAGEAASVVPFGPDWHLPADVEHLYPQRLIIAKAKKVIKKRLVSGCACGCRGDFVVLATPLAG